MIRSLRQPARPSRGLLCFGGVRAFTLAELVVLMALVGIIGVLAAGSMSSLGQSRARAACLSVARDLAFARERSMATGLNHWVVFSPSTDSYSVLVDSRTTPGYVNAATLTDPATGAPMLVRVNAGETVGVDLVSASFDSALIIGFDWRGVPRLTTGAALAGTGSVVLGGSNSVSVAPISGRVTYAMP